MQSTWWQCLGLGYGSGCVWVWQVGSSASSVQGLLQPLRLLYYSLLLLLINEPPSQPPSLMSPHLPLSHEPPSLPSKFCLSPLLKSPRLSHHRLCTACLCLQLLKAQRGCYPDQVLPLCRDLVVTTPVPAAQEDIRRTL